LNFSSRPSWGAAAAVRNKAIASASQISTAMTRRKLRSKFILNGARTTEWSAIMAASGTNHASEMRLSPHHHGWK
jgi:hypothetical protein